ncbi:LysR family transcriptional regulator [Kitasatospora griseola]|uniref:LysR family transcriptional regulator n=1 Tax=Kitasatospora griseola TaxID=2064 RepID=UPI0037F23AE8
MLSFTVRRCRTAGNSRIGPHLHSRLVDVSSRKLRHFVAVAEELHFSRAAARLFVTQQSLSTQIRELEKAVGVTLLHRTTRSVELMPAGEVLLAAVRKSPAVLDTGMEAARPTHRGENGRVKVGFVIGAALEPTPLILAGPPVTAAPGPGPR